MLRQTVQLAPRKKLGGKHTAIGARIKRGGRLKRYSFQKRGRLAEEATSVWGSRGNPRACRKEEGATEAKEKKGDTLTTKRSFTLECMTVVADSMRGEEGKLPSKKRWKD